MNTICVRERLVENHVERRVGNATAIPEQFTVDARAGQPGGREPLARTCSGAERLLVAVEEYQRARLDVGCANRQTRLLRIDQVEVGESCKVRSIGVDT